MAFWKNAGLTVSCILLAVIAGYLIFWHPTPNTEKVPDVVKRIIDDAAWDKELYMRWTVTDWVLGLLAAGTAITAAVKNAFSSHTKMIEAKPAETDPQSAKIDKWVMVFAALTIIATTLDSKMHAGALAERYRMSDLLLQDAIMDYRGSKQTDADQQALLNRWHEAQNVLEGKIILPGNSKTPNDKPKLESAPAMPKVTDPKPTQTPATEHK